MTIIAGSVLGIGLFLFLMSTFIDSDVFDPKEPMAEAHLE